MGTYLVEGMRGISPTRGGGGGRGVVSLAYRENIGMVRGVVSPTDLEKLVLDIGVVSPAEWENAREDQRSSITS